ncbi:extensin-like [Iris pallida]|uniref:Extensin-like n=1 Tax=Iris pallida TaxID=29817 RepID=A0AAX6H550_IRIPA|nr:extensin-like [Iris pallida]
MAGVPPLQLAYHHRPCLPLPQPYHRPFRSHPPPPNLSSRFLCPLVMSVIARRRLELPTLSSVGPSDLHPVTRLLVQRHRHVPIQFCCVVRHRASSTRSGRMPQPPVSTTLFVIHHRFVDRVTLALQLCQPL